MTLREDAADNGLLRIDNTVTYTKDYVYVGEDSTDTYTPAPGGYSALGLRTLSDTQLYVVYPDVGVQCDNYWNVDDVNNYGKTGSLQTYVKERDLALNS